MKSKSASKYQQTRLSLSPFETGLLVHHPGMEEEGARSKNEWTAIALGDSWYPVWECFASQILVAA